MKLARTQAEIEHVQRISRHILDTFGKGHVDPQEGNRVRLQLNDGSSIEGYFAGQSVERLGPDQWRSEVRIERGHETVVVNLLDVRIVFPG